MSKENIPAPEADNHATAANSTKLAVTLPRCATYTSDVRVL